MQHSQISYFSNQIDRNIERLRKAKKSVPRSIILDFETCWEHKSDAILLRKLREIKAKTDKLIDKL